MLVSVSPVRGRANRARIQDAAMVCAMAAASVQEWGEAKLEATKNKEAMTALLQAGAGACRAQTPEV